ncbi:uncharacterized protein LOC121895268 [Thunnus maccoyii]|uniref:uncharacterized protein LOC121895268 n=1 Tax=Thunnus maccoyii TaxID=8240 RepID=UPI001C4CC648|nr:uncharacterized protein LOC121895268 [Thunnus maccoyii]
MALKKLLWTQPDTPYCKPPPIHMCVLKLEDQPRVVAWDFQDNKARAATIKNNKVAVISNGQSVTKVTLFEEFGTRFQEGRSYILRGRSLRGQSPPFFLSIGRCCQIFRTSDLAASEQLRTESVEALLHPSSPPTHLRDCRDAKGLMTIEGQVVEISALSQVRPGRDLVPLRRITLEQDTVRINLSLWREAAVTDLNIGDHVKFSHVKASTSDCRLQLQTTNCTETEKAKDTSVTAHIIGVMEVDSNKEELEVLLETGEVLKINEASWQPFDGDLKKGKVEIQVNGKHISHIQRSNREI